MVPRYASNPWQILTRLTCALTFLLCCAWGATGHKITAQIAYGHLTPKARAEVDKLLAGSTLAEFSVWADQIKSDPAWAWTKPWHYADLPEGATGFKMDRDCPPEGCVVAAIQKYGAELKDPKLSFEAWCGGWSGSCSCQGSRARGVCPCAFLRASAAAR